MPYRQIWFDASKDLELVIYPDLPAGYAERPTSFRGYREAELNISLWGEGKEFVMYFCDYCKGWIFGEPNNYEVNTLRPHQLAGRKGTEFYCRRCGKQIAFVGIMS